jgi:hypothetical protein
MTAKSQAIVVTICGLLLAPTCARANHVNLDGIGYVLFGLLVLAIMLVVNMVLFFVNLSKKKRSRAIKEECQNNLHQYACSFSFVSSS